LTKRIRGAEQEKTPYILVVGEKEEKNKAVAVRQRGKGDLGPQALAKFVKTALAEVEDRE
jgi:threonyl-tRNA synthetase